MDQTTTYVTLLLAILPTVKTKNKPMQIRVKLEPSFQLQVLGSPAIAFEPSTDREAEVMEQVELIRSLGVAADRDMQNWWTEYSLKMGNYTLLRNASICSDPEMLQTRLNAINTTVVMVCKLVCHNITVRKGKIGVSNQQFHPSGQIWLE